MFELTITRIKYPKNDTIEYEYESLDNLLMELKQMIIDKKVNKDDIIRIRGEIIMNKEDYNKYYIQGSDHYLIPKDVFKELFNEMVNWKEESQKQKEVIDRIQKIINTEIKLMGYAVNDSCLILIQDVLKEVSE